MAIAYRYTLPEQYYYGPFPDGGIQPSNSTYVAPTIRLGKWPRWPLNNPDATAWEQVDDHRERKSGDFRGLITPELAQEATKFWLPEDNWQSPPRTMKEIGPLPKGHRLTPPPPTVAEAKALKWSEIVQKQAAVMAEAKKVYPDDEREGWPYKLPEAEAIMEGKDVATPYIDAEFAGAAELYNDKKELAQKIVKNNTAFKELHGFINGQQSAMYHALEELSAKDGVTGDEILAMPVEYTLPEGFNG